MDVTIQQRLDILGDEVVDAVVLHQHGVVHREQIFGDLGGDERARDALERTACQLTDSSVPAQLSTQTS